MLDRYDIVMPVQFIDLFHWAKLRDFGQEMNKDSDYRFKEYLLSLDKFIDKGLASTLSCTTENLSAKEDSQARRIILIKVKKKINLNTQGTRGRQSASPLAAAKELAFWKDTSDTRPVPLAVRLKSDEHSKQLSTLILGMNLCQKLSQLWLTAPAPAARS